jgi:hypothetical protein
MRVDRHRRTGRDGVCTARRATAGILAAATLSLTGCLPAAAGQGIDVRTPGVQTGGVPASAQPPPPAPELPA